MTQTKKEVRALLKSVERELERLYWRKISGGYPAEVVTLRERRNELRRLLALN